MLCYLVLSFLSRFAIILMGRESLLLYFNCLPVVLQVIVSVLRLFFITVLWVGLQCVIEEFSDHTHVLS